MQAAHDFFHAYLIDNTADADTLTRMHNVIAEFSARAPKMIVMKCIDGRVHGSAAKGYPPTTVLFGDDVALLTSYSYRKEKRFYPVKISRDDSRPVYPADVISAVNSSLKFSNMSLKAEEALYKASFSKKG